MESLAEKVNLLTEKTLAMEDPRLQKEIEKSTDSINQSQPLRDYEEENQETASEEAAQDSSEDQVERNQDFYPTESSISKQQKVRYLATIIKYSPTMVKSRNFLSNISYTSVNKCDFYNENFILDVYILLVKNLNPFSRQRKISDKFKHEMIYMLWRECIPVEFYRYICQEENFRYLNGRDVSQPGVFEIVGRFIDQDKENLRLIQKMLSKLQRHLSICIFFHVSRNLHNVRKKRNRHEKQFSYTV